MHRLPVAKPLEPRIKQGDHAPVLAGADQSSDTLPQHQRRVGDLIAGEGTFPPEDAPLLAVGQRLVGIDFRLAPMGQFVREGGTDTIQGFGKNRLNR